MITKYVLILISALSFNLASIFPTYFYWLNFFYLVPVFYLYKNSTLTFKQGMIWGIFVYTLHFYYLFILIQEKGNGELKFLVPIFLIFYFSVYSGLWFFFTNLISSNFYLVLITFAYIYFIYFWSFWIFQFNTGYVFTHPLLPLISNKKFFFIISKMGIWVATFCLISSALLITHLLTLHSFKAYHLLILLLLFNVFDINNKSEENILTNISYIPLFDKTVKSPYEIGEQIKFKILNLVNSNPKIKIIVMPESVFPFALNKYKEIINWWYCDLKAKNIHILLGANRREGKQLYNTVYHLYNGKIVNYYDKRQLVFFAEYIPGYWSKLIFSKNLFLKTSKPFCAGQQNVLFDIEGLKIIPCICSEMYLHRDLQSKADCIFFFANETWFNISYIRDLMLSFIKLKKIELKKNILYISNDKIIAI